VQNLGRRRAHYIVPKLDVSSKFLVLVATKKNSLLFLKFDFCIIYLLIERNGT
jgi:hypothetical protein